LAKYLIAAPPAGDVLRRHASLELAPPAWTLLHSRFALCHCILPSVGFAFALAFALMHYPSANFNRGTGVPASESWTPFMVSIDWVLRYFVSVCIWGSNPWPRHLTFPKLFIPHLSSVRRAARLLLACCSLAHLARHRLRAYLLRTGAPSSSIGCVSMSLYDGLTLTFIVVPSSNIGGFVEPTTSATIFSNTLAIVGSYFSSACTVFTCSVRCPPVFVLFCFC